MENLSTLKALAHHMVHRYSGQPDQLGAVRLNKALWYTDVSAFKENGRSVTGEAYVKRQFGPVPQRIAQALDQLRAERRIDIEEPAGLYDTRKFTSLTEPDRSVLTEEDRKRAEAVVDMVCNFTASEISDMSHNAIWDAARMGEEIPLYATLAANEGEITPEVIEWAAEHIRNATDLAAVG